MSDSGRSKVGSTVYCSGQPIFISSVIYSSSDLCHLLVAGFSFGAYFCFMVQSPAGELAIYINYVAFQLGMK